MPLNKEGSWSIGSSNGQSNYECHKWLRQDERLWSLFTTRSFARRWLLDAASTRYRPNWRFQQDWSRDSRCPPTRHNSTPTSHRPRRRPQCGSSGHHQMASSAPAPGASAHPGRRLSRLIGSRATEARPPVPADRPPPLLPRPPALTPRRTAERTANLCSEAEMENMTTESDQQGTKLPDALPHCASRCLSLTCP